MIKRTKNTFQKLIDSGQAGGALLILCVIISLIIANTGANEPFKNLLAIEFGFETPAIHLKYSLLNWINDGLMAVFFFLIGIEIKQEITDGHLSSFKIASVPIFAALGGALLPAIIYAVLNRGSDTAEGWGIPMATDIAFALAVLSLVGKAVPTALRVLLSTLAVVDDLLAILVIAIFYSSDINWKNLCIAAGIFIVLLIFNKLGIQKVIFYIIPGILMWYFIHHSGIHATIAGVLTALTLPVGSKKNPILQKLEHSLAVPVGFIIMPLFALANTNIHFEAEMISGITGVLGLGIIIGLVLGKPAGIMLFSLLSVKFNIGKLPKGIVWRHIVGIGLLAGIGFTMSIFIALLSFGGDSLYGAEAKFAILIASLLSGIGGFVYLKKVISTS
ncbi:MAG: Na+/H+ antiporter NhaA [Sphingobacteriaceae bacterium]|nr:MAG: Na+/H+ antiporter NhaA [Sphingobacteriaceae bacterium]